MRLISQDQTYDFPYEGTVLSNRKPSGAATNKVFAYHGNMGTTEVSSVRMRQHGIVMGEYENEERAVMMLLDVQKAYAEGIDIYSFGASPEFVLDAMRFCK